MPIYSEDGQQYENEALYRLGEPTNESKDLSGNGKKERLKVTITPHMNAGEGEFDTPLNKEEQESYARKYGPDANLDYDMQGFHKYSPDFTPGSGQHFPDTYKKPNHPTFSNESIYSGGEHEGGQWEKNPNGAYQFTPGRTNLENRSPQELQEYFNKVEPGNKLNLPQSKLDEPKEVHIVRHGETTENADNTVRGWEPVSINDKGIEEAHKAGKELKDKGVQVIVSSDLQRAKETSDILKKETGAEVQYDPRLRTWNVGEHAGKPCETSNPILKEYAQNKQDEPVPGGESFNDFQQRSFAGIRDAVLNNKDKEVAILTHNRVEATLKGWEKTGQTNPDIDYNEVVKEETEPGTVRTVKFEPDATILQPNVQVAENFGERFGNWGIINPGTRNEVYSHPDMFQRIPGPNREPFGNIPEEGKGTEPVIKKEISPTMKRLRQSLVDHIMGLGENAVASLHDLLLHPENLPMTGELGMIRPTGFNLGELLKSGKSLNKIAEEHNIPYKTLQQQAKREGLESQYSQFAKASDSELDIRVQKGLDEDKSYSQIAKELGISRGAVAGRINRINR